MTPTITPELVRRYLLATGWTVADDEWCGRNWFPPDERRSVPDTWIEVDPLNADMLGRIAGGQGMSFGLVARLGMLAAADMLLNGFVRPWTSWPSEALDMICRVDVDPAAWEKARSQ